MIFCADCGSRLGYHSQNSKDGKWDPMAGGFQCSKYRNVRNSCFSHYIGIKDLEAALLKAVQTVSEFVLEDEDVFIDQLMSQWELKQAQTTSEEKKEMTAAKKRISELDTLIQGLYESQINGTIPERQVQRLIKQYDEEQSRLESRISELESKDQAVAPKKADINRFVALVRKYQHITVLTDEMLYEFIEKVVVHAPNGKQGIARRQKLDVYFNFIGNYLPPMPEISEEELDAQVEAIKAAKKQAKQKRNMERQKEKIAALKEAAMTDPEAAAEYEQFLERRRAEGKKQRERQKALREADPEYQRQQAEKAVRKAERQKRAYLNKAKIPELESLAETDPVAAEILIKRRETAAEKNRKVKENRKARIASDPDYAALQADKARKRNETVRQKRADLKERAKTDPEAAAEYEAKRARERENAKRYNAEKRARAAVDPEYAEERAAFLKEKSKKDYQYQKAKMDDLKERAETDSKAAAAITAAKAAVSEKNRKYRENLKEAAKTDPAAQKKIEDRLIRRRELERQHRAEKEALNESA